MKILKNNKMNEYELEHKKASYKTIVDLYVNDLVLCNNIPEVDTSIWDNVTFDDYEIEIYQYYLCNLSDWQKQKALEAGLLLSYSNLLDLDILCVDHFGTSWDYVLTDVEIVENFEDLDM